MAVTSVFTSGSSQFSEQLERIMKSHSLRGSETLVRLLQYCAKQSLEHPDDPLKEYQIAREVFGRGPDFDPQSDSCVRVQAGRLRHKLAEYYNKEGAADPVEVKLPKGSYHIAFEPRSASAQETLPEHVIVSGVVPTGFWRIAFLTLLTCVLTALVLGAFKWNHAPGKAPTVESVPSGAAVGPLAEFWRPFTSADEEPWVIFSNATFVGRPETGMRYYNAGEDPKNALHDHYTGVGEVLAVHDLDELFAGLGRHIKVKRGSLFSLDDTVDTNLIFVGSPSENLSLRDIPTSQEFIFQRMNSGARKGDLGIENKHPKPNEAESYLASPSSAPLTEDYAVVVMVQGATSQHTVMILAGTTTFGTQGAVEFVTRPDSVAKLLQKVPAARTEMKPFEALLHVKIARGVPVDTELVALRPR